MTLSERLREYIAAAFTGIWIQSHEHEEAIREIAGLCHENQWSMATWDVDRGLRVGDATAQDTPDPVAAIKAVNALAESHDGPDASSLLVLPNFHRLVASAEVAQALAHQIHLGKQNRTFIVILSPVVQIPVELEKVFVVVRHELPGHEQLEQIARSVATEDGELPEDERLQTVLSAASGLTRLEAEGAFSLSLVRHGDVRPEAIWEIKSGLLEKNGLLTLHRGGERFADLGGLAALKGFCTRALRPSARTGECRPRGILLLGVPGTGKSAFAKALGSETDRPTVVLDVGALLGSLVGATEENVRRALQTVDAMAPCVLFIDEVEKALSGAQSSGQTDSGVSARLFGTLLTWLSDHESDVFVLATCNDIAKLPPEFSRAERFDGVFFLDLPSAAERQAIWTIHRARFAIGEDQPLPDDTDWTGAEIRSCCRLAALLDVPLAEAATNVVPVSATAAESVEQLRHWAEGRCLSAHRPGVFTRRAVRSGSRRARSVSRSTSMN